MIQNHSTTQTIKKAKERNWFFKALYLFNGFGTYTSSDFKFLALSVPD